MAVHLQPRRPQDAPLTSTRVGVAISAPGFRVQEWNEHKQLSISTRTPTGSAEFRLKALRDTTPGSHQISFAISVDGATVAWCDLTVEVQKAVERGLS